MDREKPSQLLSEKVCEEVDCKVELDRFLFLHEDPFLLQDCVVREKAVDADQLDIDWTLSPDRPTVQTISLTRFCRSYLAGKFHIRIANANTALVMPDPALLSFRTVNLKDLTNSNEVPPALDEFYAYLDPNEWADRYVLLHHYLAQSWEMVGFLAPLSDDDGPSADVPNQPVASLPAACPPVTFPPLAPFSCDFSDVWSNPNFQYLVDWARHTEERVRVACPELIPAIPTSDGRYQCTICFKRFVDMKAYRSHAIIHDPSKRLACPFDNCPYVSHRKDHMDRHVRRHWKKLGFDPSSRQSFSCPSCSKGYINSYLFELHIRNCPTGQVTNSQMERVTVEYLSVSSPSLSTSFD